MSRYLAIAGAVLSILLPATTLAVPERWVLSGVTFDDGALGTGSFFFDLETDAYSNWVIEITRCPGYTPGTPCSSIAYSDGYSAQNRGSGLELSFRGSIVTSILRLEFAGPLENNDARTSIPLLPFSSFELFDGPVCTQCNGHIEHYVTSGSIVGTVPEPDTYAMVLIGLALLCFEMRRRRQAQYP